MNTTPLEALADNWEEEANDFRQRGLKREARMVKSFAEELRQTLTAWKMEALTVADAAAESGYSESHLRSLLSDGSLENVGRAGAPRVRRLDLPAKARAAGGSSDFVTEAVSRRA